MEINNQSVKTSCSSNIDFVDNNGICSYCGTPVHIDPMLIYYHNEWDKKTESLSKYWHSKYSYSKEIEPNKWLTFCKKVCEINYNRQYEDGWEYSLKKRNK